MNEFKIGEKVLIMHSSFRRGQLGKIVDSTDENEYYLIQFEDSGMVWFPYKLITNKINLKSFI